MNRFTQLFDELDQTTRTTQKVAALENYFRQVPARDAAWALEFLSGRTLPRAVSSKLLWQWTGDETGLPAWLIEECHNTVGDMAETMALVFPDSAEGTSLSLSELVEQRLLPLRQLPENARRTLLVQTWREFNARQRFVWNKLITGHFRVGVARTLVVRALATVAGIEPAIMAHRVLGKWTPSADDFNRLISGEVDPTDIAKPYPFFLASPVELKIKPRENMEVLGEIGEWLVEWKWDGIRAQLIRRGLETLVWSRGDEMVTDAFPELVEAGRLLPEGTVLDGEVLAWQNDRPLPFTQLQRRLGRKKVSPKTRAEFPIVFVAYDLLELARLDVRTQTMRERRAKLEELLARVVSLSRTVRSETKSGLFETPILTGFEGVLAEHQSNSSVPDFPLHLSPLVHAESWEELGQRQRESRVRGVEGVMLKKLDSSYGVGRQRGTWWKWKIDPLVIDAVLISAQRGHGRRANLYSDYTFALWDGDQLVSVAKAYSGLTNEEIHEVDEFVRRNTLGKFGPVRSVKPELVFELAFEGIQISKRHKAGVAVRFPRMNRWRHDKKPADADTLENLRSLAAMGKIHD